MLRLRRKKYGGSISFSSISPFIDKKIFEYSYNLLGSSYLKTRTEAVFDYLNDLFGKNCIGDFFKKHLIEKDAKKGGFPETAARQNFYDFDELCTKVGKSCVAGVMRDDIRRFIKSKFIKLNKKRSTDKKLDELREIFQLNEIEAEIIAFLYVLQAVDIFESHFGNKRNIDCFSTPAVLLNRLNELIGCAKIDVQRAVGKGNISKNELLDKSRNTIGLQDWITEHLSGISAGRLAEQFCSEYKGESLNIEDHFIDPNEKEILSGLIKRPNKEANILFYGEPGTGKTELAKSLASTLKKALFIVNSKGNESISNLKTAIIATTNIANPKNSIILVDEADILLNTGRSFFFFGEKNNKSWINAFLDESKHKIIWITNESECIESSTMRRFAFSMRFKRFNITKKLQAFRHALGLQGLGGFFTEDELKRICGRYAINAGGIVDVVKNLGLKRNSNKKKILERMELILKNHEIAITGKRACKGKMKEIGVYSLKALNASENLDSVISMLKNFYASRNKGNKVHSNLNLLFYGPPGTGKTEFAKYLAKALDKELVLKRGSDLISKWLGESEKLIAGAFEEAEENGAILFLDEADSFLYPRQNAVRSWEMTQTNELLTQMENFRGVLICATNFKKGLDEAALRRFKFKIEFKPLSPEGNLEIYKTVLAPLFKGSIDGKEAARIKALKNLTPGDFHVVAEKYSLIDGAVTHGMLINSLAEEARHKDSKSTVMGFGRS
jgi:SpoVK/Ycf46/Vps4 family AAA+-type ATPase